MTTTTTKGMRRLVGDCDKLVQTRDTGVQHHNNNNGKMVKYGKWQGGGGDVGGDGVDGGGSGEDGDGGGGGSEDGGRGEKGGGVEGTVRRRIGGVASRGERRCRDAIPPKAAKDRTLDSATLFTPSTS